MVRTTGDIFLLILALWMVWFVLARILRGVARVGKGGCFTSVMFSVLLLMLISCILR